MKSRKPQIPEIVTNEPHTYPQFLVDRATAQDKTLSYGALGLLTHIQSYGYVQFDLEDLLRDGCSMDDLQRWSDELAQAGLLIKGQ